MTNRKSHVIRIYKDNDRNSEQWVDIERLDELYLETGTGAQYRAKTWQFHWDEFDPDGPAVTKKQIVDPNDEDNFIEVPVRDKLFFKEGRGLLFQNYSFNFVNDGSNETRETHSRRVYHHDIPDDRLDESGQPPSDPREYLAALGEQDMDQYVEVELLDKYKTDQNEHYDAQGYPKTGHWQGKSWLLDPEDDDPLLQDPMLPTDEVDPDFVPVNNPEDGPQVDPPWRLDPLQNIVNVQWAMGRVGFLYSGADGMFGSRNGTEWKRAKVEVPATSLAWVDDVWVGCNPSEGCWRSEDGGKSWDEVGSPFEKVVAMKPAGVDAETGKPKPGLFCAYKTSDDAEHEEIYISSDLGESFDLVLTIPTTVGDDGSENVNSISGCGGLFFILTQGKPAAGYGTTAYCYTSNSAGTSFGGAQIVFGPGTDNTVPDVYPARGFGGGGVGYDPKDETYICTGLFQEAPSEGLIVYRAIYTTSSDGLFAGGTGTPYASVTHNATDSVVSSLSTALSAAGGDGQFVTGYYTIAYDGDYDVSIRAVFLPSGDSSEVEHAGPELGFHIGSFCFKQNSEDDATIEEDDPADEEDTTGVFACVAYDAGNEGGVHVAQSDVGGWSKTHTGSGPGAVAVGKLKWSEFSDDDDVP